MAGSANKVQQVRSWLQEEKEEQVQREDLSSRIKSLRNSLRTHWEFPFNDNVAKCRNILQKRKCIRSKFTGTVQVENNVPLKTVRKHVTISSIHSKPFGNNSKTFCEISSWKLQKETGKSVQLCPKCIDTSLREQRCEKVKWFHRAGAKQDAEAQATLVSSCVGSSSSSRKIKSIQNNCREWQIKYSWERRQNYRSLAYLVSQHESQE